MPTSNILLGPIVGGLSDSSVNIWARADTASTLYVWLATHEDLNDARLAGEAELPESDGFAGIVPLAKLKGETQYYYAVSLDKVRPAPHDFHKFKTFPKPSVRHSFSFLFGSCYLPNGEAGSLTYKEIHAHVDADDLRFGIFLGDQIYADNAEHNGIERIAVTLDDYRSVYAKAWLRKPIHDLLPDLPLFMILDDHEVDDDWRWNNEDRSIWSIPSFNQFLRLLKRIPLFQRDLTGDRIRAALKAYQEHQAMHAPQMSLPFEVDSIGQSAIQSSTGGTFAYEFTYGGAAFFVLDTRTMRVKKGKDRLLGDAQWKILEQWFLKVKNDYPVKFLVSSGTIFYPFLLDVGRDRWTGFPYDRNRLLQFIAENEIEGIYVLTGDLHSAHCVSAEIRCPSGRRIPIWEFCSSPFEQKTEKVSATYFPMFSKWVRNQKKHFRQTGNNFGIVNLSFDEQAPKVTFNLHYNQDGWKVRTIQV